MFGTDQKVKSKVVRPSSLSHSEMQYEFPRQAIAFDVSACLGMAMKAVGSQELLRNIYILPVWQNIQKTAGC